MSYGINREEALELLELHIKNPNLIKHCLASEAVMAALAERLGEDVQKWSLAGLLHDLDVELTKDDFTSHGTEGSRILKESGGGFQVANEAELFERIDSWVSTPEIRRELGAKAQAALLPHQGAVGRNVEVIKDLLVAN